MEAATVTLSFTLQFNPLRLFTCTGHKPTITINPRNKTMTFQQRPTLIPHGHIQVIMCGHKSRHVAHVVRAGKMNGDDGNRARVAVGPTLVLAGVLGRTTCRPSLACACSESFPENNDGGPPATPALSILEALMNMGDTITTKEALMNMGDTITTKEAHDYLTKVTSIVNAVPARDIELPDLQKAGRKLACSGKTDEAVGKLKKKYDSLVKDRKNAEAHDIGLVLVEMLIYQGNYHGAKKLMEDTVFCDLKGSQMAAVHNPYKAVIHLMLDEKEIAQKYWKEFIESAYPPPEEKGTPAVRFEKFKEKIEMLRRWIEGRG